MSKTEKVIRQGFVANTNAEGRLKGWDDESLQIDCSASALMQPPAAAKRATSNLPHNRFGLVEQIREDVPQGDEQAPVEPMADIIRRRRSTSLTFFKGILGF